MILNNGGQSLGNSAQNLPVLGPVHMSQAGPANRDKF